MGGPLRWEDDATAALEQLRLTPDFGEGGAAERHAGAFASALLEKSCGRTPPDVLGSLMALASSEYLGDSEATVKFCAGLRRFAETACGGDLLAGSLNPSRVSEVMGRVPSQDVRKLVCGLVSALVSRNHSDADTALAFVAPLASTVGDPEEAIGVADAAGDALCAVAERLNALSDAAALGRLAATLADLATGDGTSAGSVNLRALDVAFRVATTSEAACSAPAMSEVVTRAAGALRAFAHDDPAAAAGVLEVLASPLVGDGRGLREGAPRGGPPRAASLLSPARPTLATMVGDGSLGDAIRARCAWLLDAWEAAAEAPAGRTV